MSKLLKLIACLADAAYRRALIRHGVAAAVEHSALLRACQSRTVVDVGANRGQFALVSRQVFPNSQILSFEPLPGPAARFRSLFAADAGVSLHEAAIGPESGTSTIHISRRDDSSSLLPITDTQVSLFPGTAEAGTATIKVGPLREFVKEERIQAPALLKIDVQGYELQALRGCESLLHRFGHVYVECSFVELYAGQALAHEVVAWLEARGFRLSGTHNMTRDASGSEVQADFLFTANRP